MTIRFSHGFLVALALALLIAVWALAGDYSPLP